MKLNETKDKRIIKFFETLEEKLNKIHNNKYDYSETIYINKENNIVYKCNIHGHVTQNAGEHTRGHGCRLCGIEFRRNQTRLKYEKTLISDFKKTHGEKYTYENVEYTNGTTKVDITCKQHGSFLQKPDDHKSGYGCPYCAREHAAYDPTYFIIESENIHNKLYTYNINKTKKMLIKDKIEIICKLHGSFFIKPKNHINGKGCPNCVNKEVRWTKEHYRNKITILYYIKIGKYYKIGLTKRNVIKRFETEKEIKKNIEILNVWEFKNGGIAFELEKECLDATKKYSTNIKILKKGGNTELRTENVINIIKPIIENAFN